MRRMLEVRDLLVTVAETGTKVVNRVSFSIAEGETVALVGESGSGKSLTAKAIAGLLPRGVRAEGHVGWHGRNLLSLDSAEMHDLRGSEISLLLQDPFTMLNPLTRIGSILKETVSGDGNTPRSAVVDARITEVGIAPARVRGRYPWELSGGMRQRIGLAAAVSQFPRLLMADEPTTALDATTQRDVLKLIRQLQSNRAMSLLLITHDLRIAMSMADRLLVMSNGSIVDEQTPSQLRSGAKHSYTRRLLASELPVDRRLETLSLDVRLGERSAPQSESPPEKPTSTANRPIVRIANLTKSFDGDVLALAGVSVDIVEGRSLGVIGESGSGKTTLGRCLIGLEDPTSGSVKLGDTKRGSKISQRQIQCVFQDPYSSLNPMHTIGFALREALRYRGDASDPDAEVTEALERVGLDPRLAARRPSKLSGGQRQRIAIARALLMRPSILVCDEPVAALDLTVQSQVLQVLRESQQRDGLTMVFITHDLSVARQMTDELIVLHQGRIVEYGVTADVLTSPTHEYTKRLLASVPTPDRAWLET